jgi:hypothetical protein
VIVLGHLAESLFDHLCEGDFYGELPAWCVAVDVAGAVTRCGERLPPGELVYRPHGLTETCPACLVDVVSSAALELARSVLTGPERSEGPHLARRTLPLDVNARSGAESEACVHAGHFTCKSQVSYFQEGAPRSAADAAGPDAAGRGARYEGRRTA